MEISKVYGDHVKKVLEKGRTDKASAEIISGLRLEGFRIRHFYDKRLPKAVQFLNENAIVRIADALDSPDTLAWTNIFAPVEILQCFDLTCASMEALSSYLAGFHMEDTCIDAAEAEGIASTLCSYHKCFIGMLDRGLVPAAKVAVTTTLACDANLSTFRYVGRRYGVPVYAIDVPGEESPEAVAYLTEQLKELIALLESMTGKKVDQDRLREIIVRENNSKRDLWEFAKLRMIHQWPSTLTLNMFQLFATHLNIGMPWVEQYFHQQAEEIRQKPLSSEKRLFWVHLQPFFEPSLKDYLNFGSKVAVAIDDFDLDYMEEMDPSDPLKALARKMIRNIYNGPFTRKVDAIEKMVTQLEPDGVVEFCHWGCKQSSGGVMLLKDRMRAIHMPMLVLDGDAIDRRGCQPEQIRTRFEAFLELLGEGKA